MLFEVISRGFQQTPFSSVQTPFVIWDFTQILMVNLFWRYELTQFSYVIWTLLQLANPLWLKKKKTQKYKDLKK